MTGVEIVAIVGAAAAAAGTATSIYAQQQQAESAKSIADYNAKVKENEAKRLEQEQRENLRRDRARNKKFLERQRALIVASGVEEAGSPLEVLSESAGLLELEALDRSRSRKIQAQQSTREADLFRAQGQQSLLAGQIGSVATGLSGVSQVGSSAIFTDPAIRSNIFGTAKPKVK